jgi:hypothetical protein
MKEFRAKPHPGPKLFVVRGRGTGNAAGSAKWEGSADRAATEDRA